MTLQVPVRDVPVRELAAHESAVREVAVREVVIREGSPRRGMPPQVDALLAALDRAQATIGQAALALAAPERYLAAHLAAQQVAGVVLAAKGARLGAGPCDPWDAIALVAPGCGEWAAYFSALQPKRRAVAAGVRAIIGEREADDLVRDAQGFHDHVVGLLQRCLHRATAPDRTAGD